MIAESNRWRVALYAAVIAAGSFLSVTPASALSLGRISVQSALGEPLRAEIDLPGITAEESASLKTSVALPEAFRSAGIDYNPIMSSLQISQQKRTDGRSFLRISSDKAVNDPFIDLILDASWSAGRIVSFYTMLLDPPNLRQAQAVSPTLPVAPTPAPAPAPAPPGDLCMKGCKVGLTERLIPALAWSREGDGGLPWPCRRECQKRP